LRLELETGVTTLRAWFVGEGLSQSPYYVEARWLRPETSTV